MKSWSNNVRSPIVPTLALLLIAGACVNVAGERSRDIGVSAAAVYPIACPGPLAIGQDVADELDRVCPLDAAGRSPCPAIEDLLNRLFKLNDQLVACRRRGAMSPGG